MAFPVYGPNDAGKEYSPEGSNKTWIWDGSKWMLVRVDNLEGAKKLDDLTDVSTTNKQDGIENKDLLSYNPTHEEWQVVSPKDVVSEAGVVEELDDLADVDIKNSEHVVGTKFLYYVNANPAPSDGFGRYSIDLTTKTIKINKTDLNGADASELAQKVTTNGAVGHRIKFENPELDYEATTVITEIPTIEGHVYSIKYENGDLVNEIYQKSQNGQSVFFSIALNEFRGLSDGSVLVYKDKPGKKWEPTFIDSGENKAEITLSANPPANPKFNDMWIDSHNYYMYVYTPTSSGNWGDWVAVTGPGGIDGGSDIVNDSTISIAPTRGLVVQRGGSFSLNQPKNQIIEFSPQNIVILDDVPPSADERLKSDIWIDSSDYKMYIWNEYEWVGLTAADKGGAVGQGFNYMPCEIDGGFSEEHTCQDYTVVMDGGRSSSIFCTYDDPYTDMRPGAIISEYPPTMPTMGTMWFDSSRLELKVWYGTENSTGRWVSALNPASSPILPTDPDPDPVRVTGPNTAAVGIASANFACVLGSNLLLPAFAWSTTDKNAYIQPIGSRNLVQIVFSTTGTHQVQVSVSDRSLPEAYYDTVKVVVTETPANVPLAYDVKVNFFSDEGRNYYVVNNQKSPYLTFVRGRKYSLTQEHASNNGFPLRLYRDDGYGNKTDEVFEEGVVYFGGDSGLEIMVANDAPNVIHYDNFNAPDGSLPMGGTIYLVGEYSDGTGKFETGLRPSRAPNTLRTSIVEVARLDNDGNQVVDADGLPVYDNKYGIQMPKTSDVIDSNDPSDFELVVQPELTFFADGTIPGFGEDMYTYTFVMSYPDNQNHPLRLFYDQEKNYPFDKNVVIGEGALSITFKPTDDMPSQLYYQCENHPEMGGVINILRPSV